MTDKMTLAAYWEGLSKRFEGRIPADIMSMLQDTFYFGAHAYDDIITKAMEKGYSEEEGGRLICELVAEIKNHLDKNSADLH